MLAIIKSGAAYLPMDPANPAERLRYMLAAVDARAVVTSRALADIAHRAGAGRARLLVDELPPAAPGSPVEPPMHCRWLITVGELWLPPGREGGIGSLLDVLVYTLDRLNELIPK